MVVKIYGFSVSTCTRRVALVCKELNILYELIEVDLARRQQKSPEFLEKQPFGQVPVLNDDGFEVYESRAICRYLAAKAGSPLLPHSDLKALAKFEQAASIEINNFDVHASKLMIEKLIKEKRTGVPPDEKLVRELVDTLDMRLAAYDTILSKQKYLAGNEITLADLFHVPVAYMLDEKVGYDFFKKRPNLSRWWNDVSSRETWKSVRDNA